MEDWITHKDPHVLLPNTLINEILNSSGKIKEQIVSVYELLSKARKVIRSKFLEKNLLRKFENTGSAKADICGIDGACVIDSLLTVDVVCIAAVCIGGEASAKGMPTLTKEPDFDSLVLCSKHDIYTSSVAMTIMAMKEIMLGYKASYNVFLFDGSAHTPFANVAKGLNSIKNLKNMEIAKTILDKYDAFRSDFREILCGSDEDKIYAFVSKYVATNLLSKITGNSFDIDDRSLATIALDPDEYMILPRPKQERRRKINLPDGSLDDYEDDLSKVVSLYFKPKHKIPARKN